MTVNLRGVDSQQVGYDVQIDQSPNSQVGGLGLYQVVGLANLMCGGVRVRTVAKYFFLLGSF
jgi:hypothetical protein